MLRAANGGVIERDGITFASASADIRGQPSRVGYTFVRKPRRQMLWTAELSKNDGSWESVSQDLVEYS